MIGDGIMPQLLRKYEELAEMCYRTSVAYHDDRGRLRRGHRRRTDPALVKKVDLDAALTHVYQRFFGGHEEDEDTTVSISNNRFQGRVTENRVPSPSPTPSSKE